MLAFCFIANLPLFHFPSKFRLWECFPIEFLICFIDFFSSKERKRQTLIIETNHSFQVVVGGDFSTSNAIDLFYFLFFIENKITDNQLIF